MIIDRGYSGVGIRNPERTIRGEGESPAVQIWVRIVRHSGLESQQIVLLVSTQQRTILQWFYLKASRSPLLSDGSFAPARARGVKRHCSNLLLGVGLRHIGKAMPRRADPAPGGPVTFVW